MIIDAHADIGAFVAAQASQGRTGVIESDLLADFRAGGLEAIVSACYLEGEALDHPKASALEQIRLIHEEVDGSGALRLALNRQDILKAKAEGRFALMLSLEGAEPLEQVDDLDAFYREGVRFIGLVWSRENRYAYGCHFKELQGKPGLKSAGFELLEAMHTKHMIADISHLNDAGMFDVLKNFKGIPIASHSNARSVTFTPRNMTDEQLRLLAERGGVVGLNSCRAFVNTDREAASMQDMYRHLQYLVHVAGEDHVGFGFDLCDRLVPHGEWKIDTLPSFAKIHDFVEGLPFPDRIKDKITHQNWLRIYETLK